MTRSGPISDQRALDNAIGVAGDPTTEALNERRRRIVAARRKSVALGQIAAIMARSEPHSRMALAELKWLVMPPVKSGQFMIASKRSASSGLPEPAAAVLWAQVSNEIDAKLFRAAQPFRLDSKAWNSGPHLWLMEAVGDTELLPQMIKHLGESAWKGETIKIRSRRPDGSVAVQAVGPLGDGRA